MTNINKINLFGTSYDITDKTARSAVSAAQTAAETAQSAASAAQTAADTANEGVETLKESQMNVTYSDETLNFTRGV